jgi:type IX secretion system PorP/SprF family membrane protein
MKKFYILFTLFFLSSNVNGQQDMAFSMYMFNPTVVNPATVGYQDRAQMSGIFRYQWVGIEGAPRSGNLSFHSPLGNKNMALGANIKYDKLGLINNVGLDINYAYRIRLTEETRLSLGLMASIFNLSDGRSNAAVVDPEGLSNISTFIPNFGAGAYLFSKRYFVGASVPHFLKLKYKNDVDSGGANPLSRQYNHYFFSAGYVFGKEDGMKIKPQAFYKFSDNSNPNLDLNLNFLLQERFWLGVGFRFGGDVLSDDRGINYNFFNGEAIVGIFKMLVNQNLEVGYAYDYHLSRLRQATSGSHELYLGMYFSGNKKDRFVSPRYVNYF